MIYICADVTGKLPQSETFSSKGLTGLTMGRVSDIVCFGKADSNQVAYSGYKDNIEAFLFATAMGTKTSIATGHFPIPPTYVPTTPLPLPKVIFKLAKKPTKKFLDDMKQGLEKYGLEEVFVGKGDPSFLLSDPGFSMITGTLASVSLPRGPSVEGAAQLEAAIHSLRIYQCIDLFLRTNTYSYKLDAGMEWPAKGIFTADSIDKLTELRSQGSYYREGFNEKTPKVPRNAAMGSVVEGRVCPTEPTDETPHLDSRTGMNNAVLVAKPSKHPATTSYGTPSGVPTSSGILFPFFQGMLMGDTAGFRELVSSLFFRNLGTAKGDLRASFKEFRNGMGSFPTTSAGVIVTHVLKGISLALQTQTQLFLLIEEKQYHGFCLLGDYFSIFAHGTWHRPCSPEELTTELTTIRSHTSSLKIVTELFGRCKDRDGNMILIEDDRIEGSVDLADLLSQIDIKESAEEDLDEMRREIRTLSFPSKYRTFKPEFIAESIRFLTTDLEKPFPRDLPIFISSDWSKMGTKEYKVFASFGPRSFSFRNATGTEIKVPGTGEEDPMARRDEAGKLIYPRVLVGEKAIAACLAEWEVLKTRGMIKMDLKERAQGSRNHVFMEKSKEVVWAALKEAKAAELIGTGVVAVVPEKRTLDVAFGAADFETVTW